MRPGQKSFQAFQRVEAHSAQSEIKAMVRGWLAGGLAGWRGWLVSFDRLPGPSLIGPPEVVNEARTVRDSR